MTWRSHAPRLLPLALAVLAVGSIGAWFATRSPLPRELRIATAAPGGQYHAFASELVERLEATTGSKIELVGTAGSQENARLLREGEVDLAIVQASGVDLEGLSVLAPLYPEVVALLVRRGAAIGGVVDLAGVPFILGLPGSGMRRTAERILGHYRLKAEEVLQNDLYFLELLEDPGLGGAMITTGIDNPDLVRLLASGDFELRPLLDAEAIALREPLFEVFDVPRGLLHERPAAPATKTRTVATTALLAIRAEGSEKLISAVLGALYGADLPAASYTQRIPAKQALARSPVPLHPTVRRYLDPFGPLNRSQALIESLTGLKELLVGSVALGLLTWDRLRTLRRRRLRRELGAQKERLDQLVQRTMKVERACLEERDPEVLQRALTTVARLKLEALDELTHEDLRSDRMFLIFLQQCSDLSARLERRITLPRPKA